jgi:hypothetical protein
VRNFGYLGCSIRHDRYKDVNIKLNRFQQFCRAMKNILVTGKIPELERSTPLIPQKAVALDSSPRLIFKTCLPKMYLILLCQILLSTSSGYYPESLAPEFRFHLLLPHSSCMSTHTSLFDFNTLKYHVLFVCTNHGVPYYVIPLNC